METFKVGDRVRVDEGLWRGKGSATITSVAREYDFIVHHDDGDDWAYNEDELILLEDTMECTVNGVTYRQLRDITLLKLINARIPADELDRLVQNIITKYGIVSLAWAIPFDWAIGYASSCNEKLQWLVDQGFVEVVEERKIDIDQILRIGGIQKRGSGNLANKSAYLSRTFSWSIEIDDKGVQCLVPKHKR